MTLSKTIILCAGHGGGDNGAVGQGTTEAKEAIDITNKVNAILKKDGRLKVVLVPHDLGLQDGINWINARYKNLDAGVAVEIHKNSGGGTGMEVWTPSQPDPVIKSAASKLSKSMADASKTPNRGVKYGQNSRFGKLGWTDDTQTYALLAEAGFIDVDPVGAKANEKYATGIANGLLAIWGLKPKQKEKNMPTFVDKDGSDALYLLYLGQRTSDWGKKHAIGKMTAAQLQDHLLESDEYLEYQEKMAHGEVDLSKHLPAALKKAYGQSKGKE